MQEEGVRRSSVKKITKTVLALKAARLSLGLNRREAAQRCACSIRALEQLENGRCNYTEDRIRGIVEKMGMTWAKFSLLHDSPERALAQIDAYNLERTMSRKPRRNLYKVVNTYVRFEIVPDGGNSSILRFHHNNWKDRSGVFGKTSFFWASLYLRNLKSMLESKPEAYDWTKFDIHFFIKASPEVIFNKWTTSAGLESFFVKKCVVTSKNGEVKSENSEFSEEDVYQWDWFFDYKSTGSIGRVVRKQSIEFTFGKCKVNVTLKSFDGGTLLHLVQSGMENTERDKVHVHLDCRAGWTYFLTNLKAVVEHNVDVRDKRMDTSMSLAIGYKPPI